VTLFHEVTERIHDVAVHFDDGVISVNKISLGLDVFSATLSTLSFSVDSPTPFQVHLPSHTPVLRPEFALVAFCARRASVAPAPPTRWQKQFFHGISFQLQTFETIDQIPSGKSSGLADGEKMATNGESIWSDTPRGHNGFDTAKPVA